MLFWETGGVAEMWRGCEGGAQTTVRVESLQMLPSCPILSHSHEFSSLGLVFLLTEPASLGGSCVTG